ncbi:class I SAM-dependent methyltransferase [Candidatus Tokpelaia sp.]|uniref:class I SAM-dependent methyltransferase n=1 Tax=Candidatus Tokpelaia sp. TaxID=2233777 RepID=UPI001FEFF692|nr:class I SAM-dependent methyltransferase [Candidatus Tokpelaia sp.]
MMEKQVLDPACGFRGFYFNKSDPRVLFGDIRREKQTLCDGRELRIEPDLQIDFRRLPFADNSFSAIVFDPPHLLRAGANSWLAKKYGRLEKDSWQEDLRAGFSECFRVLRPSGCLVFKWSEKDIKLAEVLALTPERPVIGHRGKIKYPFHWCLFVKGHGDVRS